MNEEAKELISLLYTDNLSQCGKRKLADMVEKQQAEIEKKDKIIDEMIGYIATRSWAVCPNEECGANLDCENRCKADDNIYEECWRMYFERKIK